MEFVDQYYKDLSGALHWLSAEDHANAEQLRLLLPAADWTPITDEEVAEDRASQIDPWPSLRSKRDARLAVATALLDRHRNQRDFGLPTSLTDAEAVAWAEYAQKLRDLPSNTTNPFATVWPVAPDDTTPDFTSQTA
jgi:hypothetical protein